MPAANSFLWRVGLQNPAAKYLTSEDFGFELNALGAGLTRKQTWELQLNEDESVYLKNHLGRYLTTDKYGAVKCEFESISEDGKFAIDYSVDGSGRWAFKNIKFGNYLSGNERKVICLSPQASEEDMSLWFTQMAIHPQVVLHNKRRQRYFGLEDNQIRCRDVVPWGPNCIFTMEYYAGRYLIKTSDNKYLLKNGNLTSAREKEARFTIELRVNKELDLDGVAFRDDEGKYLSGVGSTAAILKSRNNKITNDDLFHLEESHPQVVFLAPNGKCISVRTGVEVSAGVTNEQTNKEIFQIEFDQPSGKWYILTYDNKYWSLNENSGIEASSNTPCPACMFSFEWMCGTVGVIASNGKYMGIRQNGQIIAKSDGIGTDEMFKIRLVNRPILVLKCEFGFVGKKKTSTSLYACNKSEYEVLSVEPGDKGAYYIKGDNGKYWNMSGSGIASVGDKPQPFVLEFMGQCLMAILAPNDKYVCGEKSGSFEATSQVIQKNCLWKF